MKTKGFGRQGWWIIIYTLLLYLFSSSSSDTLNVTTMGHAMILGLSESSTLLIYAAIGGFVSVPDQFSIWHCCKEVWNKITYSYSASPVCHQLVRVW